jgi:hypothetical protein
MPFVEGGSGCVVVTEKAGTGGNVGEGTGA